MIKVKTEKVYFAPTVNKTYITKWGAIRAEARAKIYKVYPSIPFCQETGECFDVEIDNPEYYKRKHKSLCKALNNLISENDA